MRFTSEFDPVYSLPVSRKTMIYNRIIAEPFLIPASEKAAFR